MEKRYTGSGQFLVDTATGTTEIDAQYEIVSTRTPDKISTNGAVSGLSPADTHLLLTKGSMKFRLETGDIVDVVFLGGNLASGVSRIGINSPMSDVR